MLGPSRAASHEPEVAQIKSIMNPSLLQKLEKHDGEEATFASWRFRFEGLAALIGLEGIMDDAVTAAKEDLAMDFI